jgi:hypothetical protein
MICTKDQCLWSWVCKSLASWWLAVVCGGTLGCQGCSSIRLCHHVKSRASCFMLFVLSFWKSSGCFEFSVVKWLALLVRRKLESWQDAYHAALPNTKSSRHHNTRLDKTQEQRLQDALVNVGSCDIREMLWTASCWFALAPQERDKAMMLSQLTFCESESLTKAGAARWGDCLISFGPLLLGVCFFFLTHPPSLR